MLTEKKFNNYYRCKSIFDFITSFVIVLFFLPVFMMLYIFSTIDVKSGGIFSQTRIGRFGKPFIIYKFKTINPKTNKISRYGKFLRRYKIDEIPQFFNILKGDMSWVGPRPDIKGYYDLLQGTERQLLKLKPGITSQASIKYRHEEEMLVKIRTPDQFNDEVIFPDKVAMNMNYLENFSWKQDMQILLLTIKMLLK